MLHKTGRFKNKWKSNNKKKKKHSWIHCNRIRVNARFTYPNYTIHAREIPSNPLQLKPVILIRSLFDTHLLSLPKKRNSNTRYCSSGKRKEAVKSEKATILFTATIGRACPIVKKNREMEKLTIGIV